MNAVQKLKKHILLQIEEDDDEELVLTAEEITSENIDDLWMQFQETDYHWDVESNVRGGEHKTGLTSPYSRHYESYEVAAQMEDGSWVGWTYWYGGGKHGNPEEIDWIEDAYNVAVKEEEKLVTILKWSKKDE